MVVVVVVVPSVVGHSALLAKGETPALQAPAAYIEHTRDDGVLVHLVLDLETHGGGGGGGEDVGSRGLLTLRLKTRAF